MSNANDFVIKKGVLEKYKGPGGDVVIPEGVTSIGARAFERCNTITSVMVPSGVSRIGVGAFSGCDRLKKVVLHEGIVTIADFAFCFSGRLETVNLPDGVKKIGLDAFAGCSNLAELRIPDSVKEIGACAFSSCRKMKTLHLPDVLVKELGANGIKDLYGYKSFPPDDRLDCLAEHILDGAADYSKGLLDLLVTWLTTKKVRMAWAEKLIAKDEASRLSVLLNLKAKKLPLEEIDDYIEQAIRKKQQLTLTSLLEYKNAAYPNEAVEKMVSDSIEKEIGIKERSVADWRKIYKFSVKDGEATILSCLLQSETVIEIPKKIGKNPVTRIGSHAFSPCGELTEIVIPETVREIGTCAFESCRKLKKVVLPDSPIEIGEKAFANCNELQNEQGFTIVRNCIYGYMGTDERVDIPYGVTRISGEAFRGHSEIHMLNIPKTVTHIGESAFVGCDGLADKDGFVIIQNVLHHYCGQNGDVVVPEGVVSMSGDAFNEYQMVAQEKYITSVNLPESMEYIGLQLGSFPWSTKLIRGKSGSYAEAYAKQHRIPFEAEE